MTIKFSRDGKTIWECAEEDVPSLIEAGQVCLSDYFWHEGLPEWQKVESKWGKKRPARKSRSYSATKDVKSDEGLSDPVQTEESARQLEWYQKFEASYDSQVEDLIRDDMIASPPSSQAKKKLLAAAFERREEGPTLWDLIPEICPRIMSESSKAEQREMRKLEHEDRKRWEKENRLGEYAPEAKMTGTLPPRQSDEPDATEKQKRYIVSLGFRDLDVVNRLGKKQASAVIGALIAAREQQGAGKSSRLIVAVVAAVFVLILIAALAN